MKKKFAFPLVMAAALSAMVWVSGCRKDQEPDKKPEGVLRLDRVDITENDEDPTVTLMHYDEMGRFTGISEGDKYAVTFTYLPGVIEKRFKLDGSATPKLLSRSKVNKDGFFTQTEGIGSADEVTGTTKYYYKNGLIERMESFQPGETEPDEISTFVWKDGCFYMNTTEMESTVMAYGSEPCRSILELAYLMGLVDEDNSFDFFTLSRGSESRYLFSSIELKKGEQKMSVSYTYRWNQEALTQTATRIIRESGKPDDVQTLVFHYSRR